MYSRLHCLVFCFVALYPVVLYRTVLVCVRSFSILVPQISANYVAILIQLQVAARQDDDELRLVHDLLAHYNVEVRPVKRKSQAVEVVFGVAYVQLVDLVSCFFIYKKISKSLPTNSFHVFTFLFSL